MLSNVEGEDLGEAISDLLAAFDGRLNSVATGVAQGKYAFWLGSGLSRSAVPGVEDMLRSVLTFLQTRVDPADEDCRFKRALSHIIDISEISESSRNNMDLNAAVESWPDTDDLVQRLVSKYSSVLDVRVDGEREDYLVWEGINVVDTYGSRDLQPVSEHLCLGILILEGVISSAQTANWDGLIESAVEQLTGEAGGCLRVVILQEDLQLSGERCDLIKFHGCAVKAGEDEAQYRPVLIARESQISIWTSSHEHSVMKRHLEDLMTTELAVFIGLSAQDANLHTMLGQASNDLGREWPVVPPAVVFAEERISNDQRHLLRIVYRNSYNLNHQQIEAEALLGVHAQLLLFGLVLYTLADKLCSLIDLVSTLNWSGTTKRILHDGIRSLRDEIASTANDASVFIDRLIEGVGMVLSIFRTGSLLDSTHGRYRPLTAQPILQAVQDPNIDTNALGHLAIAASLLGRGVTDGLWDLEAGDVSDPAKGVCSIMTGVEVSRIFLVQDSGALAQLEGRGHVSMSDPSVLIIHAKRVPQQQVRSPAGQYGRTGEGAAREIAIETIAAESADADTLLTLFRHGADL